MELNLKLDRRKSGRGTKGYPIIIEISKNYKQRRWRIGHFAKGNEWNTQKAAPNKKHPQYYLLLDIIEVYKSRMDNLVRLDMELSVSIQEAKKILFKKDFDIFYEAAIDSFDLGYKGTKLSAITAFNNHHPMLAFDEISPKMVETFVATRLKKGFKPSGIDSYLRSLRALWNDLTEKPNPFRGHSIEIPDIPNDIASPQDIKKLHDFLRNKKLKLKDNKGRLRECEVKESKGNGGYLNYTRYWLLMFYFGGIDPEALQKIRYDKNVRDGRLVFNRDKGQSKALCSNIIPKQAIEILKQFNCKPYLVPIFKSENYDTFSTNFARRFKELGKKLNLSAPIHPKGARYTFIDRAQQLLIDERITAQIVGHKRHTTTSIYTNDFPKHIQDRAHLKIIDLDQELGYSI